MTLFRDEDGNLQSEDFPPHLASDEDLLEHYRKAFEASRKESPKMQSDVDVNIMMMLLLCSNELGKRGYSQNADGSDWFKPEPDSQS